MDAPIYLDYNATTPVDASALDAMLPWFSDRFWNPASSHAAGRVASAAVESARSKVAHAIGASPMELIWTAGATESNNLAIKGLVERAPSARRRVLVGATEHRAVLDAAGWLATRGCDLDLIPVDSNGTVELEAYAQLLDEQVALVSVMVANNETGVLSPVEQMAELAHDAGALFHTDATQALGRIPVDVRRWGVDAASFSAHKVYGPKGAGALYLSTRTEIAAQVHGGWHERGLRSGSSNVPAIVGFGAAVESTVESMGPDEARYRRLTAALVDGFSEQIAGVERVGPVEGGLSNTVNLRFVRADAEAVMANAPEVAVSSGSACSSLIPTASHVLRAMGMSEQDAFECIRFSVGRPTSLDDVSRAVESIAAAVARVRSLR